jgi:zinc transport system substrate-binding protein
MPAHRPLPLAWSALACVLAWLLAATARAAEPIPVVVSVLPQRHFVEQVGGERVRVSVLVGPGQSPETFEPSPKQVAELGRARLFFRIGMPFEDRWIPRALAMNPAMKVLDGRDGIELLALPGHDHGAGAAHTGVDPHVWTSPQAVKRMSEGLRDALADLDPGGRAHYAREQRRFAAELDALSADIRHALAQARGRRFLVFHPAWGYFAREFGLAQIAIEEAGRPPGARGLAQVIELARGEGIRVVHVEPQSSQRSAETVAAAIGGRTVSLDALAESYAENLRTVARTLAEDLR